MRLVRSLPPSRLDAVCKKSTGSVPRNRVFSHYATRCGTERVPPLNPASFGKLVRIIFPGIQTRRLGIRGESKYHYVELSLVDEQKTHVEIDRRQIVRETSVALERPNLKRYVSVARSCVWTLNFGAIMPEQNIGRTSLLFATDIDLSLLQTVLYSQRRMSPLWLMIITNPSVKRLCLAPF